MPIAKEEKNKIIKKFGKDEYDTGSATVQIALLTHRILELTEHLKLHKKDKHTRRGLVQLVSQRKKFMKYLVRIDAKAYMNIVKQLSLRG